MKNKLLTALTLIAVPAGHTFAAPSDNIYSSGHADIGVALEDGTDFHLHLHAHDEGPAAVVNGSPLTAEEEYDAGDVTIVVPLATQASAPNNSAFNNATGVASGNSIWVLPQSSQSGVPFLGIGTEELTASEWGDITFALGTVTSPTGNGEFSLYQGDGLGGFDFYFSTADASLTENGDNTLVAAAGGHDHFSYGFSESGTWSIELTASGTHSTLGALSDTQTFTFNVVPEPSTYALLLGLGALGLSVVRRRAKK
ncbi:MAG: choice-of-anchor M domain-containing protein [Coraliomargarita sp.]